MAFGQGLAPQRADFLQSLRLRTKRFGLGAPRRAEILAFPGILAKTFSRLGIGTNPKGDKLSKPFQFRLELALPQGQWFLANGRPSHHILREK